MFIDHFNKILLLPLLEFLKYNKTITNETFLTLSEFRLTHLNSIGMLAFPIFCFLLSQGITYTKNIDKYFKDLLIFAFISEIFFDLAFFHDDLTFFFYLGHQNIFFTLACGVFMCNKIENAQSKKTKIFILLYCMLLANYLRFDYGAIGILYIFVIHFGKNAYIKFISFFLVYICFFGIQNLTLYFLIILIIFLCYNNQKGFNINKYAFYIFYPLHLLILYLKTITF